jgi:heme O synthase-like polyprenyltransferase
VPIEQPGIERINHDGYLELTKPRITAFILMSTAIGFFCVGRFAGALALFHVLLGTALMASGTATLNQ